MSEGYCIYIDTVIYFEYCCLSGVNIGILNIIDFIESMRQRQSIAYIAIPYPLGCIRLSFGKP